MVSVIAEVGVNHNGDIEIAKLLVKAASEAGADYVKFQLFSADELVIKGAPLAPYQKGLGKRSQRNLLDELSLTHENVLDLKELSEQCGLSFMCTAFDSLSFSFLASLGLTTFKIPSGEITNLPFLEQVGSQGSHILLSTGASDLNEIIAALDVLEKNGTSRDKITVMHCVSAYPAPLDEINLLAMVKMREILGVQVGFSDHTVGIDVPIAAVALGATTIEKHITLSTHMIGPDHLASTEPLLFKQMVRSIRNIEMALGDGNKRPMPSELENLSIIRKSIVAAKEIKKGEPFTSDNLTTKRPGTGVSPMNWYTLTGALATRDFHVDDIIFP